MKSFTVASALLFAAAALTGTSPSRTPGPNRPPAPQPQPHLPRRLRHHPPHPRNLPSPPLPLADYQEPITLSNNTDALLAAPLVMTVDSTRPDTPLPRYKQIGPDVYISIPFTAAHAGRKCRFHFAFSSLADGGNYEGAEEIYALEGGSVVDETLTYNKQPVLEGAPVASFLMDDWTVAGRAELYRAEKRADFVCPGVPTGFAVRGRDGAVANRSWNKGAVVEVLGKSGWWDDGKGGGGVLEVGADVGVGRSMGGVLEVFYRLVWVLDWTAGLE
ncbi:uncharacterized protein H6S33_004485 [Morchella sextelata]|uniref:uncharacterized protein n=1 Tax=Morchella sextelata TaxID=1174677 RepID=UPI001D054672|nr:uncharacterized protein H6S33_004485 [Morchella sextelata]KAH0606028.1 hypothetical protein H6S33_004485 [Morchella sextelata]